MEMDDKRAALHGDSIEKLLNRSLAAAAAVVLAFGDAGITARTHPVLEEMKDAR